MKVFVKSFMGNTLSIDVDPFDTIYTLKEKIKDQEGINLDQQRLIFAGKQLEDDRTMSDYDVKEGGLFHMVICLRGG